MNNINIIYLYSGVLQFSVLHSKAIKSCNLTSPKVK